MKEPPPTHGVDCNRSANGGWLRREAVRKLIFRPSNPPAHFVKVSHIAEWIVTEFVAMSFHTASRLVRRQNHNSGKAIIIKMAPVNVSHPILAKYRADRLKRNEATKRPTNENISVIFATTNQNAWCWNRQSLQMSVTLEATKSASKIQNKTTNKSRCRSVNSVRMTPNRY